MSDTDEIESTMMLVFEKGLKVSDPQEYARFVALDPNAKRGYVKANSNRFAVKLDEEFLKKMNVSHESDSYQASSQGQLAVRERLPCRQGNES